MAAPRDCPEIESLQALADDTAPAGMWERYEQHVESCRACQERLDQIGAGGDALQRIGRRIGDPTAVPDDPTLSEALRRLREVRSPITPAVPEGDLSFLGPRSGGSSSRRRRESPSTAGAASGRNASWPASSRTFFA